MKKKELKKDPNDLSDLLKPGSTGKKLTWAQYWEWRLTIEEMHHADTKDKVYQLETKLMEKQLENHQLALTNHRLKMREVNESKADKKKEYFDFKKKLEDSLGVSLDGCVIDQVTLEVKKI